jgi:methylglutaconyl-CoA hydratase
VVLKITKEKGIVTCILNRVEKSNSINRELLQSILSELNAIQNDNEIKCFVIKGEGNKVFCAGADLEERLSMNQTEIFNFLDSFRLALNKIESLPFPTIACMNGSAFGGGLELALACDIRILKRGAYIGLTETKLGIIPGAGGTQRLSRLIGISKAKDLIFRGARIDWELAEKYGIVNHSFESDEFEEDLKKYIKEITSSAPIAVKLAKNAINKGSVIPLELGLDLEREEYIKTLHTIDRKEALIAFKEKREPIFQGK